MSGTYHRYDLHTGEDGRITGTTETNDNNDDGYPDADIEVWPVAYTDRAMMDRVVGKSRTGWAGCKVTVMLDGKEVI